MAAVMDPETIQNVLIPVKVDAFVLNQPVCDSGDDKAKIAPITQPNYTFLRLDTKYLQSDIMNDVDLHSSWPAAANSRFTDLGTRLPRRNRQGVYIHWTMPRVYRSGTAATKETKKATMRMKARGVLGDEPPEMHVDYSMPKFPDVPNRWLVIRTIENMDQVEPTEAVKNFGLKKVTAWVVESDRQWAIEELDENIDLQVDVSPFVSAGGKDSVGLKEQAEVFIGHKIAAADWTEKHQEVKRVNLKLLGSSNQLFPDYQLHCSNVFSMVDDFLYTPEGQPKEYLTRVSASYQVLGWHDKAANDLFSLPDDKSVSRGDRLYALNMKIKQSDDQVLLPQKWLKDTTSTNSMCHGTIRNVKWDAQKLPEKIPANEFAQHLMATLPVAIGTTPMDALMTYAGAHEKIDKNIPQQLEKAIKSLEKHLLSRDDGVDALIEATDMLYNWNYSRLDGGQQYHVTGKDGSGKPTVSDENKKQLKILYRETLFIDGIGRRVKQLRWQLFAEWWKYVTFGSKAVDIPTRKAVTDIETELEALLFKADASKKIVGGVVGDLNKSPFQPGVHPPFQQQRDPTLLVGGISSGWQYDFLDALKIRIDEQVLKKKEKKQEADEIPIPDSVAKVIDKMPDNIPNTAKKLVREFILLNEPKPGQDLEGETPLSHDHSDPKDDHTPLRDDWNNTQPWFPLFLEWEIEYTHIPYKYWTLEERKLQQSEAMKLHTVIAKDKGDLSDEFAKKARDTRKLTGRVLILPQPSFSLEAKINQLFDDTPIDKLEGIANEEIRELLTTKLRKLGFLSAPLSGFSNHLLTLEQGNHVKPNLKVPKSGEMKPIPEAYEGRSEAGFNEASIGKIEIESDLTPYGTSYDFLKTFSAFKPVTHGQFKITKLNIMDKFGQAIHAIDPTPRDTTPKIFPCISEWYAPQSVPGHDNLPNVIERDKRDPTRCEYVQVPTQINQPTRINACFVMPNVGTSRILDEHEPFWRPALEWDTPIWGWVIINYANYGIQIFLPDGTFFREVRLGGENGAVTSPEWLPFPPPSNPSAVVSPEARQLALLIEALQRDGFLRQFVDMINDATATLEPAPSAFAEFTNALIGRPLALVNMSWSLELATDSLKTQLVKDDKPEVPEKTLLPTPLRDQYGFKIKLGDRDREFDGLVGYFDAKHDKEDPPKIGDALKLDKMYSHFKPGAMIERIGTENYPELKAFWVPPDGLTSDTYEKRRNQELSNHVFGALLDPFSAVHAYSGILPVKELALPSWTWQTAMSKMKAFFHAGPLIVPINVPEFNSERELKAEDPVDVVEKPKGEIGVQLPALSSSEWTWLQPYVVGEGKDATEKFMPLAVETMDGKARFHSGPLTALEGYLQLANQPHEKKDK